MPRRIIYALLTLSALLLPGVGRLCAQFHPVHASVVWASPRTPYLPDFYSGSRDRLVITLTNRDATQPVLHVRMRVRIRCGTGELRSREELPYPHIVLSTGIPHRITNTDLAAYLQPDRLTNAHILRNGQLPDGFTEISVQAVDLFTGKALSDWHTARSHLSVNKPPFLIAPERDATVALTEPTAILFRWQPRLATATEYEFTLKELPSTGESPQGAFPYGHVVHRETVRGTMLSYTHLHPPLIANRLYAWQIRAIQRDGIDEVSTYENGGYSEVSWFRLTDGCAAPTHLHAHPRYAKVELRWRDAPKAASYTIQIRPKTRLGIYEWQAFSNVSSPNTIRGLLPGRTYEWRVGASCTDIEPVYSEVEEFTLSTENEELLRDCGKVPEIPKGVSQEPHLAIKVGDVVTVGGDYPLTITEIEPLGDGWYAGRGRTQLRAIMYIPLAMRFDSLRINVDYRQIGGVVEAETRDYTEIPGFEYESTPILSEPRLRRIDIALPDAPQFTFDRQTGQLQVFDIYGQRQTFPLDTLQDGQWTSAFPVIITDSEGQRFQLWQNEDISSSDSVRLEELKVVALSVDDKDSKAIASNSSIRFSTKSDYNGEFGFDNGEVFTKAGFPKPALYSEKKCRYNDKDYAVDCFITIPVGKEIEINVNIMNRCDTCYVYEAVAIGKDLACSLMGSNLKIQTSTTSYLETPYYMLILKKKMNDSSNQEVLGVCEIQCLLEKLPYNIQLLYLHTDSTKNNALDINLLRNTLKNNSLNQAFIPFNINENIDTIVIFKSHELLQTSRDIYINLLYNRIAKKHITKKYIQDNRTIFIILNDLTFVDKNGNRILGEALNKNGVQIPIISIYLPSESSFSYLHQVIVHEISHTLGLLDVIEDRQLDANPQKYGNRLRTNYMNYAFPLKMYFRSQIKTMYEHKNFNPIK